LFTGIIEKTGTLKALEKRGTGARAVIACEPWNDALRTGESVCVNGACLTVVDAGRAEFACDVLEETLARTSLGRKPDGAPLNLERALRAGDRMGGHIVTGHVDGVGKLAEIGRAGDDWVLLVRCRPYLLRDIAPKGSVALDGVSLTVVAVQADSFSVHIIPFTRKHTSFSALSVGDEVNIETDILAKYIRRDQKDPRSDPGRQLTMDDLRSAGYL